MNIYATIILCFIPFIAVFLLFKIFNNKISVVKELLASLIGLIAVVPITFLQFFCGDFLLFKDNLLLSLLFRAIVLYGLVEEGIKCGCLFIFPTKKVNGKLMFLYSLLAGLFLGSFESVIYVITSIQNATTARGQVLLHLIYLRTFTSIVVHTFCAGLLGLFVYSVKNKKKMVGAVVTAVLMHGLYDFFTVMNKPINYFAYVTIVLLILECKIYYDRVKKLDEELGK